MHVLHSVNYNTTLLLVQNFSRQYWLIISREIIEYKITLSLPVALLARRSKLKMRSRYSNDEPLI